VTTTTTPPEIRLVNNIAVQFGHLPEDRGAQEVANHVLRFWDPRMRARLLELAAGGGEVLHPAARGAVALIRDRTPTAPATAHDGFVALRSADGALEVDLAAPDALRGLGEALGIRELSALPADELRTAVEQVTARWTTSEVLVALEQDGVPARRATRT
jgi:formate dehydrogenase subunit delta